MVYAQVAPVVRFVIKVYTRELQFGNSAVYYFLLRWHICESEIALTGAMWRICHESSFRQNAPRAAG